MARRKVWIVHPVTGGRALVPETALAQHSRAGWRLEEEEEATAPVAPVDEPESDEEDES